ncbi:MAG: hypothetical protein JWO28_1179 [Hyphomicrobiales bacterium]|nr:hypothetical protein [Hyphomicrobiales bacterium]
MHPDGRYLQAFYRKRRQPEREENSGNPRKAKVIDTQLHGMPRPGRNFAQVDGLTRLGDVRTGFSRDFRMNRSILSLAAALLFAPPAGAQPVPSAPPATTAPATTTPGGAVPAVTTPASGASLTLSATFTGDNQRVPAGVVWRVFRERAEENGSRPEQASSSDPNPTFNLANGDYIVHAAYGLASATRRVSISGRNVSERIPISAGAMRIIGMLGDNRIPPERLTLSIYVPDGGNPQAKLVARDVKPGQVIRLPEGTYHIVSTYLDASGPSVPSAPAPAGSAPAGPTNATNSVVEADVRIQAGKVTVTTLKHRAALITLKLVNAPGGEALANTSFTVLTPGGDVLREMIGAFPSLVLAEGEYAAIARRDGKTYQGTFAVKAARDRDVEVLAK